MEGEVLRTKEVGEVAAERILAVVSLILRFRIMHCITLSGTGSLYCCFGGMRLLSSRYSLQRNRCSTTHLALAMRMLCPLTEHGANVTNLDHRDRGISFQIKERKSA